MLKRWTQAIMVAGVLMLPVVYGQEKKVKDQAEFDLIQAIQKEPDAKKRVDLVQQWMDKYPTSEFKSERLQTMVVTQQAAGNLPGMRASALELIKESPKVILGYQFVNLFAPTMNDKSETALADSEKAALGMLDLLKTAPKPANLTDAQWEAEKKAHQVSALRSLAFVKLTRNDFVGAEGQYLEILKVAPGMADVSQLAGYAVFKQKNAERQAIGLFHYARAATFSGAGALNEAGKKSAMDSFKRNYVLLRENDSKMDEFMALTKDTAIPPEGLSIKMVSTEMAEALEKLKETNPQLALWITVKKELVSAGGEAYFADSLKDRGLPKLKGKVISHTPALRPTKVVIALENDKDGEMTLVFAPALPGKADPGTEIEFADGTAKSFIKDPFMQTVSVDPGSVTGWPVAVPPARPAAPVKRPVGKKK